ncbi:tigger transposable element-derived protein 6-like [Penaeus monodon]|uniref:tigger transposable element-derived protein 6-like n=1 Tax=Penaeus monodon TaxID=6687 RepID=UPI0018A75A9C|nr:tigger transposable element-derived protein 6-like [Penaeus monodon]
MWQRNLMCPQYPVWLLKKTWTQSRPTLRGSVQKKTGVKHAPLDEQLHRWFLDKRAKNLPITGPILQQKAHEIADRMGITGMSFSAGWLTSWKARYNISSKVISGAAAAVDLGVVDNWQTTTLPENLKQYPPSHIYNCDESALFYRLLPNKSLVMKEDTCHGGKRPKACTNMDGSDKAWMTSNLFTQWSKKLDRRFKREDKVALVLDNCPAHPGQVPGLTNITLFFLPPNTISKTQPLDLGIIQNLKMYYREELLLRVIKAMDSADTTTPLPNINDDPKDDIPLSQMAVDEDDIPLASLFKQASQYMEVEGTLDDYLSAGQDLTAVTAETEDIFENVMSKHIGPRDIQEDEEDLDITLQPQPPSCETIFSHLEDIQLFLETYPDIPDEFQHIQRIARRTRVKSMNNKKQKRIADFFTHK